METVATGIGIGRTKTLFDLPRATYRWYSRYDYAVARSGEILDLRETISLIDSPIHVDVSASAGLRTTR